MDSVDSKPSQQNDYIFAIPDAHVSSEDTRLNGAICEYKPPWYRRPSAWWMLFLVPFSTMSSTGVDPSAVQIFTDLVCKSLRPVPFGPTCASDPKVEAVVSWLMASIVTSVGVLSCLTAASWASLSDRIGRKPVLALTSVGSMIRYSILILVYSFTDHLPGGVWFCIVGSSIYGLLGGSAAVSALSAAYITDCTPQHARARMLTLTHGLRYTGMALGPAFASFLVQFFGTPIASVYFMVGSHAVYFIVVVFVMPESLGLKNREENRRIWDAARASNRANKVVSLVCMFLRPFNILKPRVVHSALLDRTHKDWSLALIAVSWCFASVVNASRYTLCLYGAATFGWSAVEIGYWSSSTMVSRALTLTVIIPIITTVYHRLKLSSTVAESASNSITDDNTPLLGSDRRPLSKPSSKDRSHPNRIPVFYLTIARLSLLLQIVCFGIFPLFAPAPLNVLKLAFITLTVLAQCGAAFNPALQSLADEFYTRQGGMESGKLFGTLNVIVSIASQIVGPAIYGLVFSAIVETYPLGIFFVSVGATLLSLVALFFVKFPWASGTHFN